MSNLYEELGFKTPEFLENHHGIRIYIGAKDEDDWCVVIPSKVVNKREADMLRDNRDLSEKAMKLMLHQLHQDFTYYGLTEDEALDKADKWTRIAKGEKEE